MEKISTSNMYKYFGMAFNRLPKYKGFILNCHKELTDYGTRHYEPSDKKKNVFCLGCSMTWGSEVEYNESYPFILNKLINCQKDDYQVLNIGFPGAGLKYSIEWFKFLLNDTNPYMCILQVPDFLRQPFPDLQ